MITKDFYYCRNIETILAEKGESVKWRQDITIEAASSKLKNHIQPEPTLSVEDKLASK